jgi:2-(1,2-epoxy-1,2-dihydrophenyl)acetyl-CoA isomerase
MGCSAGDALLLASMRVGPDGGSAFVLSLAAGRVRAMEVMLLGDTIPATTALEWSLINRCVEAEQFDAEIDAIATKLASGPTAALVMTRKSAWAAVEKEYESALAVERQLQFEAGNTRDFAEGVKAFREKLPANFTGR